MAIKFYKCNVCGNLVEVIESSGIIPICCGETMEELIEKVSEERFEKHLPILEQQCNDCIVRIGYPLHPNVPEHHINWIVVETNLGSRMYYIDPDDQPIIKFRLEDHETIYNIYSYCNIHGLWVLHK